MPWFVTPEELKERAAQNEARIAAERDEMFDKISALTRYAITMTLVAVVELVVIFLLAFF